MTTVSQALGRAIAHIQAGEPAQGGRIVARVMATYPGQGEVVRIFASIAYMVGLKERALRLSTLVRGLSPALTAVFDDLAVIAQATADRGFCYRAAGRALTDLGVNPPRLQLRANMAIERAEIAQGHRLTALGVALGPGDPAAFMNWSHQKNFSAGLDASGLARARRIGGKRFFGWSAKAPRPVSRTGPVRVGIVGGTMLGATTHGASLIPLQRELDPERVQVVYYSDRPAEQEQAESLELGQRAAAWRRTQGSSDADLASTMRQDGLDIAIDLIGHLVGERAAVFAHRPAPVQASYLHIEPSGHPALDYSFVDRFLVPVGREDWMTEKCVRLPCVHLFQSLLPLPPVRTSPAERLGGPVTFGSFNILGKVNRESLVLWARVLQEVPESRLLLKTKGLLDEDVRERIVSFFVSRGVDRSRLDLRGHTAGFREHIEMLNEVDIALDPSPYVGIITTCEAHLMGVPVISLPEPSVVSGYAQSIAHQVGLQDLMAATGDAYVEAAVALAADSERRAQLRQTLPNRFRQSRLGDATAFAACITAAFEAMRSRWTEGSAPGHLTINELGEASWT